MPCRLFLIAGLAALFLSAAVSADEIEARYSACLDKVETNAEAALEDALVWVDQGGGARAQHCAGMAYVGLKKYRMGAFKLEDTAGLYTHRPPTERAELYIQSGQAYLAANATDDAERVFGFAIQLVPDLAEAYRGRASAALRAGRTERAVQDLVLASQMAPEEVATFPLLAQAFLKTGDLEAAERAIEKGLALDPAHIETLVVRGKWRQARNAALAEQGSLEKE